MFFTVFIDLFTSFYIFPATVGLGATRSTNHTLAHDEKRQKQSYAAAAASTNPLVNGKFTPSFSFPSQSPPKNFSVNESQDLFTFQEMNVLMNEMLVGLSACKSKLEQFQFISSLAIKYLYGIY